MANLVLTDNLVDDTSSILEKESEAPRKYTSYKHYSGCGNLNTFY